MIPLRTLIATGLIITASSFAIAQESSYTIVFSQEGCANSAKEEETFTEWPEDYLKSGNEYVTSMTFLQLWSDNSSSALDCVFLGDYNTEGYVSFKLSDKGSVYATRIVVECENFERETKLTVNDCPVQQFDVYEITKIPFTVNGKIDNITVTSTECIYLKSITVYYTDTPDTPDTPIIDADQVDSATSVATVDIDGTECYSLGVDVSFVPNSAADEFKLMYGNKVLATATQAGDNGSYHFAVTGFEYQSGATFSVVPVINSEEQDAVAIEVSDWPDFENNEIELPAENTMLSVDLENGWFYLQVAADKYVPSDFQVASDLEASITYDASQALIKIIFPDYFVVAGDDVTLNITPIYSVAYQAAEQQQSRAENYFVQQIPGQTITRKYAIPVGVSSIVDVEAIENYELSYYDLAGRQVSGRPTLPGVYLVKFGNKVTKVAIR